MSDEGRADSEDTKDSGLARERTDLAWNRSGLAVAVAIAVILRRLWPLRGDRAVIALALIALGASVWVAGMRLGQRARSRIESEGALPESTCRLVTAGTLVLAVAGFVIGIVLPT